MADSSKQKKPGRGGGMMHEACKDKGRGGKDRNQHAGMGNRKRKVQVSMKNPLSVYFISLSPYSQSKWT